MKAHLMFRDRGFDPKKQPPPSNAPLLIKDLELEILFAAMAAGDPIVLEVVKCAVLAGLDSPEAVRYRQAVLSDCLEHSEVVRQTYAIAVEALEREKKVWGYSSLRMSPEGTLYRCREVLGIFFELLKRLRRLAQEQGTLFRSEGFSNLFRLLVSELSDGFLAEVEDHLQRLSFRYQLVLSAKLGAANQGVDYILRKPGEKQRWWQRLQGWRTEALSREPSSYTYEIPERDEQGAQALSDLRARGIAGVAAAISQATDHLLDFFRMLRTELAFFVGALNLHDRLRGKGTRFCLPEPTSIGVTSLAVKQLLDVSLVLSTEERVVGNDLTADAKSLVMITGANRGGKSTFLRSVGQAQLMMQCGLFVCAEAFRADLCTGVFTHYKKEEDDTMKSGKLDEELSRMSAIVDKVRAHGMVLCNESFGSTNEREGSEIARQIVVAFLEHDIKVLYVTHMYELAHHLYAKGDRSSLFLRAERLADGTRTFRVQPGEPLETSYGVDLYRKIFGTVPEEDLRASARSV